MSKKIKSIFVIFILSIFGSYFINFSFLNQVQKNVNHNVINDRCHCRRDLSYNDKKSQLDEFNSMKLQLTCGFFNSFRRGKKQKVIGYSLYGKEERYLRLLPNVSRQIKQYYPGWIMRVYHDSSIPFKTKCELECLKDNNGNYIDNVDFCNIESMPIKGDAKNTWNGSFIHAMMWRWFPIGDSYVDVFSSRDSDSVILEREVDASKQWLASGKPGHIMRGNSFLFRHTSPRSNQKIK